MIRFSSVPHKQLQSCERLIQLPAMRRMSFLITSAIVAASIPIWSTAQTAAPTASKQSRTDDSNVPTTVTAEQMTGRPDRVIHLDREVELTRGQTNIKADKATFRIIENETEAHGCVRMLRFGDKYTGDDLLLNTDTGQGFISNPTFWFQANEGHGNAERIDFEDEDRAKVITGTYTTCPGTKPDWYIKSSTLDLDTGLDEATANNGILYFKNVPILAAPSISFPMSNARRSGVLPPIIGTTNKGGLEINIPYYFNIAPNRDLTLYPNVITQRGLQLGADARYLGMNYSGQTKLEFLPTDQLTKTDRYALQSIHSQILGAGFSTGWNVNLASDNNYPDDFPRSLTQSSQRLLNREFDLNYAGSFWSVAALASRYQVLQDFDANGNPTLGRPYDRLPQVTLTAAKQDVYGFDWVVNAQYTRFWNNNNTAIQTTQNPLGGERVYINPQLSYPIIRPGYFLTPKIQLDVTNYKISNNTLGAVNDLNRVLSTFSIDGGLIFERDTNLFDNALTQTLEPRLFYVRTPFKDQTNYPLFDTGAADFNFAQIFTENRYVGHDRISDANQLTGAIVSRFIEESGLERLRVGIGQRLYFNEPRVALGPGDTITTSRSDLLLSAGGQLTSTIDIDNTAQYSQSLNQWVRANSSIRWQPGPKKVVNLAFRLDHNNFDTTNSNVDLRNKYLKQVDVSAQWPLANRWYGVGRVNYSLQEKRAVEGLLGLEYKADCWVFRMVAQRLPTSSQRVSTGYFFQLELNGLSSLGSNPMAALRSSVPGYQNVNQPDSIIGH